MRLGFENLTFHSWCHKPYFDLYDPESLLLPPRGPRIVRRGFQVLRVTKRYRAFGFDYEQENLPLRRAYTHAYLSCLSFADAQIGVVLDALESANLTEDTLILLASDNGYLLGEYRLWGKDNLYENCVQGATHRVGARLDEITGQDQCDL